MEVLIYISIINIREDMIIILTDQIWRKSCSVDERESKSNSYSINNDRDDSDDDDTENCLYFDIVRSNISATLTWIFLFWSRIYHNQY